MVTNRETGRPAPLLAIAIALVVIAAACAGWFGYSWSANAHSSAIKTAQARDQALQQGKLAVQDFNTLDYRHLSQGLALWKQSSTGSLFRELTAGTSLTQFEQTVSKAKTITTATVLDGSLTALNEQQGTATIIVALQLTVTPAQGSATTKRTRLEGTLTHTSSGWKLSALSQVPVGSSAGSTASP